MNTYVKPAMLECRLHPSTGLWCREDGCVLVPESGNHKAHWTFGSPTSYGYLHITLRGKKYYSHRLICETFHDNSDGYETVDHLNRIRTDNRADNLRFASYMMQQNNRQVCEDRGAYDKSQGTVYRAENCDEIRAKKAIYYSKHREERLAHKVAYYAKQKALGKRNRRCPDGKHHWLTDEEYETRFGQPRLF